MKIKIGQHAIEYPELSIVSGVTLCTGISGSGKTTLLKALHGLIDNDTYITLIENRSTSLMPQQDIWISYLTLEEQLNLFGGKGVLSLAERLKLNSHFVKYPDELSVGQLQRFSLALTMSNDSDIVLLDEPTSALDDDLATIVFQLIEEYVLGNTDMSIVAVTHDIRMKDHFMNSNSWML